MLHIVINRIAIWWKFKQLHRTFVPLLEKANAFHDRDTVSKLEEQYWYQTACLLEERRELLQGRIVRKYVQAPSSFYTTSSPSLGIGSFPLGSEQQLVRGMSSPFWTVFLWIILFLGLLGIVGELRGWWRMMAWPSVLASLL